jgi:hypothetical protein
MGLSRNPIDVLTEKTQPLPKIHEQSHRREAELQKERLAEFQQEVEEQQDEEETEGK